MAKTSPKHNRKNRGWNRRSQPLGSLPLLIAVIGALSLPLTYFAQSMADGGRTAPDAAAGGLRISEVMTSNLSTPVDGDGALSDWIELQNASGAPVDLTGWALARQSDPADAFVFSGGVLQPGEFALVCADGGASGDGRYHAPFRLAASG